MIFRDVLLLFRVFAFLTATTFAVLLTFGQFILPKKIRRYYTMFLMRFWGWCGRCIFGLRIRVIGRRPKTRYGSLIVSNHVSYWDIFVLGSLHNAVFLSKAEVKKYPLIGFGATLAGVLFVDRASSHSGARSIRDTARALHGGTNVIAFPEGTTTSQPEIRRFKEGIFKTAVMVEGETVPVQPVALVYQKFTEDGWGHVPMGSHFRRSAGRLWHNVYVKYGKIIEPGGMDSSELRAACEAEVTRLFAELRHFIRDPE